jgi:hypothetical protein
MRGDFRLNYLKGFEKSVLRKISGPNTYEVTGRFKAQRFDNNAEGISVRKAEGNRLL